MCNAMFTEIRHYITISFVLPHLSQSIWGSFLCKIVADLRMVLVSSLGRELAGRHWARLHRCAAALLAEQSQHTELTGAIIEHFNGNENKFPSKIN